MIFNYNCGIKSLRIAIGILVFGIILLAGTASSAVVGSLEIRGEAAQGPFEWDANNFPAFFYDIQSDVKSETLNVININGSIINSGQLIYSTRPEEVSFNFLNFGKYQAIGFMTEKYFAGYNENTTPPGTRTGTNFSNLSALAKGQLHKVLIDDNIKRTISVGGTLALKEGYVLKATDIDLNARTMLLSLLKDGSEVDSSPITAGDTYIYTKNVSGIWDLPLIMVRFDNIFSGNELQVAFLKGLFQISDNPMTVKVGDKFDKMNVTNVSIDTITMNNYLDIGLPKNTNIGLMGNIKFKAADSDYLRYYPFVEFTRPGKYEVRGPVFNGSTISSWNGRTFSGFYYDVNKDISSEVLTITNPLNNDRIISKEQLWYNTTKTQVDFKVYQKEGVTVNGLSSYSIVGWQGEKYVAINDVGNKLARLVFEMGRDDKKTLATGETWSLGAGYELEVNDIDVKTPPRQVWFTIKKDGIVIDEAVVMAPVGSSLSDKQKAVYTRTMTIQGESDALLFTIYIDSIFSGATSKMVQFKYAWLIDSDSANEIRAGDRFGDLEVKTASWDMIQLSNTNAINLSRNTEPELFGGFKLKVADSDQLRFYLKKDYEIPDQSATPSAPSILINNGDAYSNLTIVKLNVSSGNAMEMSFSNDNIYWSGWEAFSSTKLWKLSNEDGLKTVYFKARNAAGETSQVSDTITLVTSKPLLYNKVEIRAKAANEQDGALLKPAWNAQSFNAFYYDLKYDRSTETLVIDDTLLNLNSTRIINKDVLWYNTTQALVDFKAYEKEGVLVNGRNSYGVVGWQGEKRIAIKGITNKLATLVFEMGKEDKKTMLVGESWKLGSGYELKVNSIDAMTPPRQVWFTLTKDGVIIDEAIGQAPAGPTIADKEKAVYFKTMTLQGEPDALLFTIYIDTIFSGSNSDLVQFKYGWLIDKDSAIGINAADRFGVFEVRSADSTSLALSNEDIVNLSGNTEPPIIGKIKFKIADSDELRFYPFIEHTTPGTYEVRGEVALDPLSIPSWNGSSFAGLYYDLDSNIQTENLSFTKPLVDYYANRVIPKDELVYNTTKDSVYFKAFEKEGVLVNGKKSYEVVGWQGDKYVATKGVANKLGNLIFEMGKDDYKILTTGETWSLGGGYELTANAIDAKAKPKQVWLSLRKDGTVIDEVIVPAPENNNTAEKQKAVYIKTMTIQGESDALLFTIYVDRIFSGPNSDMAQFKYGLLIDPDSVKEISAGDVFDTFEVREANSNNIRLTNEKIVSLAKNTESILLGKINLKIADNDTLRLYPKVDYVIPEGSHTTGPVHNINKGTNYTTIQTAIDNASSGDEIHVDSGTYYENVDVNKQLILHGIDNGNGMPVVDANGNGSAITLSASGTTLDSFIATRSEDIWPNAGIKATSNNNTLINNYALNNNIGIDLSSSSNNTIYNNHLNNTNNFAFSGAGSNTWNTTRATGTNIIGGPYIGGNFWANPGGTGFSQTCSDANSDGICDSPYTFESSNIDYLPLAMLVAQPGGAPAIISFSPLTSTVTNNAGESIIFSITVNQTVNVSWTINETEVIKEANVTTSSYTNTNTSPDTRIVNATATNANGIVSQKWTWVVNPISSGTGSISGMKFNDLNNNSIKDTGETGLAGWTIVLTGGGTATMTTNANGSYTFSNLAQGNYTVAEVLKPDWKQTLPANGTYNITIAGEENLTGMDFGNNLPVTPPVNVTKAVRIIEKESLIPGESTNITVDISSNMSQALALHEIIPAGWNLTRISDDADAFKNNTSESIWFNVSPGINKTVIYRLTAPDNISIGTYHINGTISSASGVIAVVQGDNTITLDIKAFYRRLGSDTNKIETMDVLTAAEDWRNNKAPAGFEHAITTQEFLSLIDEWMRN